MKGGHGLSWSQGMETALKVYRDVHVLQASWYWKWFIKTVRCSCFKSQKRPLDMQLTFSICTFQSFILCLLNWRSVKLFFSSQEKPLMITFYWVLCIAPACFLLTCVQGIFNFFLKTWIKYLLTFIFLYSANVTCSSPPTEFCPGYNSVSASGWQWAIWSLGSLLSH